MQDEDLVTVAETATMLGVSYQTLYNYRKDLCLRFPKPVSIGPRRKFFVRSEVIEWKENQRKQRGDF